MDQYLLTMLAKRLNKPDVELKSPVWLPQNEESRFFAFLTGTESIRIAMQKDALLATAKGRELATQPIPKAALPPAVTIPEPAADVQVEPLAMVIPPEYFYARLQGYDDLSWARQQIDQFGADLRDLSTARGFDFHLSERIENQLELRDTKLAQMLGATKEFRYGRTVMPLSRGDNAFLICRMRSFARSFARNAASR